MCVRFHLLASFRTFPGCSSACWLVILPSVAFSGAEPARVSCRFLAGCVFAVTFSSGIFSGMILHFLGVRWVFFLLSGKALPAFKSHLGSVLTP